MDDNRCFDPGCMIDVEYECPCSSPPVYICKMHVLNHIETSNKYHAVKSIFVEPCENTRETILLAKCDSHIIEDFNIKFNEERNFRNIIVEDYSKEKSEILEGSKSSELERKLKGNCSAYKSDFSLHEISVTQTYQDIVDTYQQKPSLFNIVEKDRRTILLIYNTEIESKTTIFLDTRQPLGLGTCLAQLPNGKLFCFGSNPASGITMLIDENYRVQELPTGTACGFSSAIYSNNYIYCFGGACIRKICTLSSRFDLDRDQWNELTPMPDADYLCNSIIFDGSVLISGCYSKNLLRYSIASNSFWTLPYKFSENKRKILINAERLYLIECGYNGPIYESEIGSDTAWRQIANNSMINFSPNQVYCQYNKEEIYIGYIDWFNTIGYLKFNLNEKRLIKLF